MQGRLWIKDPLAIGAAGAERGLIVDGGWIVEIIPAGAEPTAPVVAVFDASHHVVLPGLVSAHHHFFQALTRAHPAAARKPLVPWLQALYPLWARLTPEALRSAVRISVVELLLSGCTTAVDHHYIFPPGLEGAVDIVVEAARDLGLRMTVCRGAVDWSEKDGGLAPDAVAQDGDTILADCERVIGLFHDRSPGSMTQIALAPSGLMAASASLLRETAALARRHDCSLHMHVAESAGERAQVQARFGCTPVEALGDTGWLDNRLWLAHGIHLDAAEIATLGRHGAGICHCAASNMTLGSGHAGTLDLEDAGVTLGLGVDGPASNGSGNMMESIRHALMLARLRYGAEAIGPRDVIRWATEGSAACLGRADIGRLAPGFCADLALYRLDEPRFAGAHDPLDALVLCGAHRADRVMVDGVWRVADGYPVGVDVAALMADHARAARAFA